MTKRARIVDEDASVKATVFDYPNSNPIAVRLTDTNGDYATAAGSGGDGAIVDGVTASIKATVLDYVGSNPLAVRLTDTAGDYVGAGAGTQYTEDAAAAADPVGTAPILVRADTPASVVSADGDNVAARANSAGAQYVELLSGTAKIGGDATNGLLVNLGANNDVTVTGTVTANLAAGTNNIGDVDVLSIAAGDNNIGNVDIVTVPAPLSTTGGGTEAAALRVTLASDSTGVVSVDDNGGSLTIDGSVGQSGTWTVQPGNTANTTAWLVSERPATSGGLTMHKTTSAASTNATSVKGSAGQVYAIQCFSVNAAARYLKLYNKASAPTVGTDTPVKTLMIPGNTAGAGFVASWPSGLAFGTGIAFALTTEATDAGTTGVAANEITVNIDYS